MGWHKDNEPASIMDWVIMVAAICLFMMTIGMVLAVIVARIWVA